MARGNVEPNDKTAWVKDIQNKLDSCCKVTVSTGQPSNTNDIWIDSNSRRLKYYNPNTKQWVAPTL